MTGQVSAGVKLGWRWLRGKVCQGAGCPHRHELLAPLPSQPPSFFLPSCCFLSEAGFLSSVCCGLGSSQLEMMNIKLLESKAGAVWVGQALAEFPLHFPGLAEPRPRPEVSLKKPPSLRGWKPSRGLLGPAPPSPPGTPAVSSRCCHPPHGQQLA